MRKVTPGELSSGKRTLFFFYFNEKQVFLVLYILLMGWWGGEVELFFCFCYVS
jgi:hypothetical protein